MVFQGVLVRNSSALNSMMDLAVFLLRYQDCFCVLLECVKVALAIPTTSAGCNGLFRYYVKSNLTSEQPWETRSLRTWVH